MMRSICAKLEISQRVLIERLIKAEFDKEFPEWNNKSAQLAVQSPSRSRDR